MVKRPRLFGIGTAIALLALVLGGCGAEIVPSSELSHLPFHVYEPTYVHFGWHVIGGFMVSATDTIQFQCQGRRDSKGSLDVLEFKKLPDGKYEWDLKATRTFYADGTRYFESVTHSDGVAEVWFEKDGYACAVTGLWVGPSLV